MSFTHVGFPIRKSADRWPFAPTHSLSQLITSFIASESQGIRHAPLLTSFALLHRLHGMKKPHDLYFYFLVAQHVKDRLSVPYFRTNRHGWRITDSNR
jgi:hypothetical protein